MPILLQALVALLAPVQDGVAPSSSAPSAEELDSAAEVLDASEPAPEPGAGGAGSLPYLLELNGNLLYTATGGEPETNLQLDSTGWRVEDLLRPRANKGYPSMSVSLYGEAEPYRWLLLRGLLDTREIRDGATLEPPLEGLTLGAAPANEELSNGNVVREASATFGRSTTTFELGRFRSDVADGLVYRDFGTGLRANLDLAAMDLGPFRSEVLLTSIGQRVRDLENNGLLAVQLDWITSPFEWIGIFIAGARDKNGEMSEVLRSGFAEGYLDDQQRLSSLFLQEQGEGGLGYLGLSAQWLPATGTSLRARAVRVGGDFTLDIPPDELVAPEDVLESQQAKIRVAGWAADVEVHHGLGRQLDLGWFLFALSGDDPPRGTDTRYEAFVALAPYWVWTGLFFSGGLNQGLYPNRSAAAGINGRGVTGAAVALEWSNDVITAEARAALLSAMADPPEAPVGGDGRLYGVELDLRGEWQPLAWLGFGVEVDVLAPGSFFPSHDLAYQVLTLTTLSHAD